MNKTPYPDGAVAAMEEQIGNQGGLGGEQADLRGWRGLILPVAVLVVLVGSLVMLSLLASGAEYTAESLLQDMDALAPGP